MKPLPSGAYEAIFAEHERDHQEAGAERDGCNGCAMLAHAADLQRQLAEAQAQDEIHWKTRRTLLGQLAEAQAAIRMACHLFDDARYFPVWKERNAPAIQAAEGKG